MSRLVVISDVHGNIEGLEKALYEANVINSKGNRMNDEHSRCTVLSMGDLANCVKENIEGDLACLGKVGKGRWIDAMLTGNHEFPYLNSWVLFRGFHYHERVHEELQRIEDEVGIRASYLKGETLITHAGWDQDNHPYISTAAEAHKYITERLESDGWTHAIFEKLGQTRGGEHKHGGILWEDFRDLRSPFPQVVGHTADSRIRYKENAICIDVQQATGQPTVMQIQ